MLVVQLNQGHIACPHHRFDTWLEIACRLIRPVKRNHKWGQVETERPNRILDFKITLCVGSPDTKWMEALLTTGWFDLQIPSSRTMLRLRESGTLLIKGSTSHCKIPIQFFRVPTPSRLFCHHTSPTIRRKYKASPKNPYVGKRSSPYICFFPCWRFSG